MLAAMRVGLVAVVLCVLSACNQTPPPDPAMVTLQTRAHRLEVHEGQRFTVVRRADGLVLARQIDVDRLAADYPSLHDAARDAVAGLYAGL